jgi:hypothetical protein
MSRTNRLGMRARIPAAARLLLVPLFSALWRDAALGDEPTGQVEPVDQTDEIQQTEATEGGVAPVFLTNRHVISSSVIVRDDTRTSIYVLGIDHLILPIGRYIRMQRIPTGRITPPRSSV